MGRRDSLATLAAFEDEAARIREAARPPPMPRKPKKVWGVVTASFRLPQTFVARWNKVKDNRRRRWRRLIVVSVFLAFLGAAYFASTLPVVQTWVIETIIAAQSQATVYIARVREWLTPEPPPPEPEPPPPEPEPPAAPAELELEAAVDIREPVGEFRELGRKGRRVNRGQRPGRGKRNAKAKQRRRGVPLTSESIVATVRRNMDSLGPCVQRAKAAQELLPGKHTFVLNWVILPNGSVNNPRMTGPAYVVHTSLPACFAVRMGGWRFPSSPKAAMVNNFPMPIAVR